MKKGKSELQKFYNDNKPKKKNKKSPMEEFLKKKQM